MHGSPKRSLIAQPLLHLQCMLCTLCTADPDLIRRNLRGFMAGTQLEIHSLIGIDGSQNLSSRDSFNTWYTSDRRKEAPRTMAITKETRRGSGGHLREVDVFLEGQGGSSRRLLRQPEVARQLRLQLSNATGVAHPAREHASCLTKNLCSKLCSDGDKHS